MRPRAKEEAPGGGRSDCRRLQIEHAAGSGKVPLNRQRQGDININAVGLNHRGAQAAAIPKRLLKNDDRVLEHDPDAPGNGNSDKAPEGQRLAVELPLVNAIIAYGSAPPNSQPRSRAVHSAKPRFPCEHDRKLQPRLAAARDTRPHQSSVKKDGCSAEMSVLDHFVGCGQ